MEAHWVVTVGNVMLVIAAIPATVAPLLYFRAPWRRSKVGKHLMTYMLALAAVLDLGIVRLGLHSPREATWFSVLRLVMFGFLIIMLWHRLYVVAAAQRRQVQPAPAGSDRDTAGAPT